MTFDIRHSPLWLLWAALVLCGCRPAQPGPGAQLPRPVPRPVPAPAPKPAPPPIVQTSTGAEMVLLPAGHCQMGSAWGSVDAMPRHEAVVDAFYIDRTEVTQEQYEKLVHENPSHFKGPKRPVEQVGWTAAARYCNLRSKAEGLTPCYDLKTADCDFQANGYRLPTEAEWEYACRAGDDSDPSDHVPRPAPDGAWIRQNAADTTHPVAEKQPNAWGLYDMLGNVAEWCNDFYGEHYYRPNRPGHVENPTGPATGERRVLRGGSWKTNWIDCRPAIRAAEDPGFQDASFDRDTIGFRCVRRAAAGTGVPPVPKAGSGSPKATTGKTPASKSGDKGVSPPPKASAGKTSA
jgi:formylglycine-generating enzyme required for sulfatase activity